MAKKAAVAPTTSIWWDVTLKPKGKKPRTVPVIAPTEDAARERALYVVTQGASFRPVTAEQLDAQREHVVIDKVVEVTQVARNG